MAFDALENSPEVAPLLVRLYDTHNLYSLAENRGNAQASGELATIMVDLLRVRLSEKESELITDVLLTLMKQAERDLKLALADRLSAMPEAPLRIVLSLANEEISIADPVLRANPVLKDVDLIYILQSKGIAHGRSIARRPGLGVELINMLADTRDFEIAVNLSENDGIALTNHAYDILSAMAKDNKNIAHPLSLRDDLPKEIAEKLYKYVGAEMKKLLQQRFGAEAKLAETVLDDITVEFASSQPLPAYNLPEDVEHLLAAIRLQHNRGELKVPNMVSTLRRAQYSTFAAQFSVFTGIPFVKAKALLKEESGRTLANISKALEISKADFVSLYLLTDRFRHHGKRVVGHGELSRIMTMYDSIKITEAAKFMDEAKAL
jgi:uncharacterized protein (DUF2336 family)